MKLNINDSCLYNILTPLFYSVFDTKPTFAKQAKVMDQLEINDNTTIALTSRGYTPVIAASTELELKENQFDFMRKDSAQMNNGVILLNGIIYTRGKNKGDALLDYLTRYPSTQIYYFDDSEFKVKNVQNAFAAAKKDVFLYHMKIAAKIPYTEAEIAYMKKKLAITINSVNNIGETTCKCENP